MPPNIFGKRFLGRRHPAWWDLKGQHVFGWRKDEETGAWHEVPEEHDLTPLQAIPRVGMDWVVEKVPHPVVYNGEPILETDRSDEVQMRYALVRPPLPDDPDPRIFGYCTDRYEPIQNVELAAMLESIATGDNPERIHMPLETIGALGHGERVFITLDAGEHEVVGEQYRDYLCLLNGSDGRTALRALYSPVRVVCQNTFNLAIAQATFSLKVEHVAGAGEEAAFRVGLMAQYRKSRDWLDRVMQAFAATEISSDEREELIAVAHPYPKAPKRAQMILDAEGNKDDRLVSTLAARAPNGVVEGYAESLERWIYTKQRVDEFRVGARDRIFAFEDTFGHGETLYAAIQGLVEEIDWRAGVNDATAAKEVMFGFRAAEKTRAFKRALQLAGIREAVTDVVFA
jgi:hypothetical protein